MGMADENKVNHTFSENLSSRTSWLSSSPSIATPHPKSSDIDPYLLRAAEEGSLNGDKQQHSLSPHFYCDDLLFKDSGDELEELIEAAENIGSESASCHPLSPRTYYDDLESVDSGTSLEWLLEVAEKICSEALQQDRPLSPYTYYDDLESEGSGSDLERIIEAAEEEDMDSGLRNETMSPSGYYESRSSSPSQLSTCSSRSSAHSSLRPTSLVLRQNERHPQPRKIVQNTAMQLRKHEAGLRHPFTFGAVENTTDSDPRSSSSPTSVPAHSDNPVQPIEILSNSVGLQSPVKPTTLEPSIVGLINSLPSMADTHGLSSDREGPSTESLHPLKRSKAPAVSEKSKGNTKRLRFSQDVYELPASPEPNEPSSTTFSTASTLVNSLQGSPSRSVPVDYERVMHIIVNNGQSDLTFVCHECFLSEMSGFVANYRLTHQDGIIEIHPQEKVPDIRIETIHRLLHWLYHNRLTDQEDENCGFDQLLELYFLGSAYQITVLKNVVIDQLIHKCSIDYVPPLRTNKIYKHTEQGDQLRQLWVDVYVWEVPGARFRNEMQSGRLDPTFVQDLALAQMHRIREIQEGNAPSTPPYEIASSVYHIRDNATGFCCGRKRFEGEGHHRHGAHRRESVTLKSTLEKLQSKLELLKHKESENTILKRNLSKVQRQLRKTETRLKRHVAIDHSKLFRSKSFDNPEIMNPGVVRNKKIVNRLQN